MKITPNCKDYYQDNYIIMSLIQKITHISVTGTKRNVTQMLNAAIRNAGTGNIIVDGDDIETISQKVMEEDGLRIALP